MSHCDDLKPHAPECMKRGHKKLAPGVYVCTAEGHLHLIVPELLRAAGFTPSPENIQLVVNAAQKKFGASTQIVD